jgi:hypothetical protein
MTRSGVVSATCIVTHSTTGMSGAARMSTAKAAAAVTAAPARMTTTATVLG